MKIGDFRMFIVLLQLMFYRFQVGRSFAVLKNIITIQVIFQLRTYIITFAGYRTSFNVRYFWKENLRYTMLEINLYLQIADNLSEMRGFRWFSGQLIHTVFTGFEVLVRWFCGQLILRYLMRSYKGILFLKFRSSSWAVLRTTYPEISFRTL